MYIYVAFKLDYLCNSSWTTKTLGSLKFTFCANT